MCRHNSAFAWSLKNCENWGKLMIPRVEYQALYYGATIFTNTTRRLARLSIPSLLFTTKILECWSTAGMQSFGYAVFCQIIGHQVLILRHRGWDRKICSKHQASEPGQRRMVEKQCGQVCCPTRLQSARLSHPQ